MRFDSVKKLKGEAFRRLTGVQRSTFEDMVGLLFAGLASGCFLPAFGRLLDVSREDEWTGWCAFFLRALIAQAQENQTKAQEILSLYRERKDWVVEVTRRRCNLQ
jgi:hypothetical protein